MKNEKKKLNIKEKLANSIKGLTFKSYVKETMSFVKENMLKRTGIMLILALFMLITLLMKPELLKAEMTNIIFLGDYIEAVKVIVVVVIAGIAPYLYAPAIGIFASAFMECILIANMILESGYVKGILTYIIPFILNVTVMAMASSIGIYICRNITLGHKITNIESDGSLDFRMSLYETAKKTDKKKKLEKEKNKKIEKLKNKKQELDLFQIINTTAILCVLQLVASLVKSMVI